MSNDNIFGSLYFSIIFNGRDKSDRISRSRKKETFIGSVGRFFKDFFTAVVKGDFFVKLSLIWWGARKQFIRTVLITAVEAAIILYSIYFAPQYITKLGTLESVKMESVFNVSTMQYVKEHS